MATPIAISYLLHLPTCRTCSLSSTNGVYQRESAPRLLSATIGNRVVLRESVIADDGSGRKEPYKINKYHRYLRLKGVRVVLIPNTVFKNRALGIASRRHARRGVARPATNLNENQGIVSTEPEAPEQEKLTQEKVGETMARAEAKARVAAAAASAAGFAVEVAEQQGAPQDSTEAVGKAADAVAKLALKAAKAVKNVQDNVMKSAPSGEDEIIQREIERERSKYAKKDSDRDLEQQRKMDKGRKAMREWWMATWDAKKRSEGWGEYEKSWLLKPTEGSASQVSFELSGEGVLLGGAPETSGSIKPAVLDLPGVSGNHAQVYGKDVVKGYKNFQRAYFVKDLGSTNGTYLNNDKLRPNAEVKLSLGDQLRFGDKGAVFELKKQS